MKDKQKEPHTRFACPNRQRPSQNIALRQLLSLSLLSTGLLLTGGTAPLSAQNSPPVLQSGQTVKDEKGNDFMDEVAPARPPKPAAAPRIIHPADGSQNWRNHIPGVDLSTLGDIQVDQNGQIIPEIRRGAGPVQLPYNNFQAYTELPVYSWGGTGFLQIPYGAQILPYGGIANPFFTPYGLGSYGYGGAAAYGRMGGAYGPNLGIGLGATQFGGQTNVYQQPDGAITTTSRGSALSFGAGTSFPTGAPPYGYGYPGAYASPWFSGNRSGGYGRLPGGKPSVFLGLPTQTQWQTTTTTKQLFQTPQPADWSKLPKLKGFDNND